MSEVAVVNDEGFRRSSHSGSGNCVEVRFGGAGHVEVRNSRATEELTLSFSAGEWEAFVAGVKDGEFDPA